MRFERIGKPIGLMGLASDFVGNMFLIVELGSQIRAIEIGSTQLSKSRGRLILPGQILALQDLQYYHELASIF